MESKEPGFFRGSNEVFSCFFKSCSRPKWLRDSGSCCILKQDTRRWFPTFFVFYSTWKDDPFWQTCVSNGFFNQQLENDLTQIWWVNQWFFQKCASSKSGSSGLVDVAIELRSTSIRILRLRTWKPRETVIHMMRWSTLFHAKDCVFLMKSLKSYNHSVENQPLVALWCPMHMIRALLAIPHVSPENRPPCLIGLMLWMKYCPVS